MTITTNTGSDDKTELVARTLAGDRDAMAEIYQRYADRIHTMCVHMLNDRDDAAEVCGDVFLTAFERLGQLKDPAKLRPWLFAICRHEVFRRTKSRNRTKLVEEVTEMERLSHRPGGDLGFEESGLAEGAQRQQVAAMMLQSAAEGLEDADRIVLELDLAGLDGDELAPLSGSRPPPGISVFIGCENDWNGRAPQSWSGETVAPIAPRAMFVAAAFPRSCSAVLGLPHSWLHRFRFGPEFSTSPRLVAQGRPAGPQMDSHPQPSSPPPPVVGRGSLRWRPQPKHHRRSSLFRPPARTPRNPRRCPTTTANSPSTPSVKFTGPAFLRHATPGAPTCELTVPFTADVAPDAAVVSVTLEWSSARSRFVNRVPMVLSEKGRWTATIEPTTRATSPIMVVAIAQTDSGISATSNTLTAAITRCVVVE